MAIEAEPNPYDRPARLFPPDVPLALERYADFLGAVSFFVSAVEAIGTVDGPPPEDSDLLDYRGTDLHQRASWDLADMFGRWHAMGCVQAWLKVDQLRDLMPGLNQLAKVFTSIASKSGWSCRTEGKGDEQTF